MKMAPLIAELRKDSEFEQLLVHTGQHYDEQMSAAFFRDLGMPDPDVNLAAGSGSHAVQTAEVMKAFEPVVLEHRPDMVIVVGDVNSTLACTLVAAKLGVPVAHVEAGLRSRDRAMPEEINRIVTDQLAEVLLTPSRDGDENLRREGIPDERIAFVGNIMIDTLHQQLGRARQLGVAEQLGLQRGEYTLVTLHRPSNVDNGEQLRQILAAVADLAGRGAIVFPIHPRTRKNVEQFGLQSLLAEIKVVEPLGYPQMLGLMDAASLVLTDSGGIQEETTALGVPCLTLRSSTERPITITQGTNTLVPDRSTASILAAAEASIAKRGRVPEFWDGATAARIVAVLRQWKSRLGADGAGSGRAN